MLHFYLKWHGCSICSYGPINMQIDYWWVHWLTTHPSALWMGLLEERGALNGCALESPKLRLSGDHKASKHTRSHNCGTQLSGVETKQQSWSDKNRNIHNTKLGCRTDKESVKFRSWVCWVCCHRNALTLLSIIRIRVWQQEKTESERRRRGRRDVWKRRRQGGQTWVQSKNWRVSVSYWQ